MTVLNRNSYKGRQIERACQNYEGKFLNQVYDKWSKAKQEAWDRCYEKCIEENGEQFSITSHNSFGFSVSWFVEQGIRYITKDNDYLVIW